MPAHFVSAYPKEWRRRIKKEVNKTHRHVRWNERTNERICLSFSIKAEKITVPHSGSIWYTHKFSCVAHNHLQFYFRFFSFGSSSLFFRDGASTPHLYFVIISYPFCSYIENVRPDAVSTVPARLECVIKVHG